jgi:8-oxo-dGTP pyrophosphatase MutT (NUDIX family)
MATSRIIAYVLNQESMETKNTTFTATDFRQKALAHAIPLNRAHEVENFHFHCDYDLSLNTLMPREALQMAAVLMPVVDRGTTASVIFTTRASHLKAHAGQIAFPGGKIAECDENVVDTALREAFEEIGLASEFVEPLALLNVYRTGTGFAVVPVLSVVSPGFKLSVDEKEVEDVFEVPLEFLMTPENYEYHEIPFSGRKRSFFAVPYGERYIWGITAGILRSTYERLYAK